MTWLRLLIIVLLLGYLSTGIYQIPADERAVVRRFGAVIARPGPGLWLSAPWGIDRVDRVRVRTVRQLNVGYHPEFGDDAGMTPPGQLLTGDQNLVNLKVVVDYAIDDRDGYLDDFVMNQGQTETVLRREAEAATAEWVAGRTVDDVLLTGRAGIPMWLMSQLPPRLASQHLGIVLQRVSVDYLAAPGEVRDAFEAVNQAQTAIRTRLNQAEQQASLRRREAAAVSYRLAQQAAAYRQEAVALARADAEAFTRRWQQYQQLRVSNPHLLTAIWWEEIGRTLTSMKAKGRLEVFDPTLSSAGLDLTQFLAPPK